MIRVSRGLSHVAFNNRAKIVAHAALAYLVDPLSRAIFAAAQLVFRHCPNDHPRPRRLPVRKRLWASRMTAERESFMTASLETFDEVGHVAHVLAASYLVAEVFDLPRKTIGARFLNMLAPVI